MKEPSGWQPMTSVPCKYVGRLRASLVSIYLHFHPCQRRGMRRATEMVGIIDEELVQHLRLLLWFGNRAQNLE